MEDLSRRPARSAKPSSTRASPAAVHTESTESKAAVEEAVHALSWLHALAGLQPLGGPPLVKKV